MSPLLAGQKLKRVSATVTPKETGTGRPSMIISNGSLDRDDDHVDPKGGDFSAVDRGNLPLVWAHDYSQIPIGRVTRVWCDVTNNIRAEWEWLQNDPLADRARNAWDQRIITASSIGFMPKHTRPNKHGGADILEWELIELSLVPVPSNREAVRELKALGLMGDARRYEREDDMLEIECDSLAELQQAIERIARKAIKEFTSTKQDMEVDITHRELDQMIRKIFPAAFKQAVADEVQLAFRRLRGRLD